MYNQFGSCIDLGPRETLQHSSPFSTLSTYFRCLLLFHLCYQDSFKIYLFLINILLKLNQSCDKLPQERLTNVRMFNFCSFSCSCSTKNGLYLHFLSLFYKFSIYVELYLRQICIYLSFTVQRAKLLQKHFVVLSRI